VARNSRSPLGGLFKLASLLPWWVGIILAVISYLVCHSIAAIEVVSAGPTVAAIEGAGRMFFKVLATFGQFMLPVIFLAASAASAVARMNHSDLTEDVQQTSLEITRWSPDLLRALEWKRFEMVCAGLFERLGFTAKLAVAGPDGGVDIHLYRPPADQAVAIVQCKARTTRKVGVEIVRALHGVMTSQRVSEGILTTSGDFSDEAFQYGRDNHIDLMDGAAVLKSILNLSDDQQADLLDLATRGDFTTPTCASCGIKLVRRSAKSTGREFWGCRNYPRCRSVINIAKS